MPSPSTASNSSPRPPSLPRVGLFSAAASLTDAALSIARRVRSRPVALFLSSVGSNLASRRSLHPVLISSSRRAVVLPLPAATVTARTPSDRFGSPGSAPSPSILTVAVFRPRTEPSPTGATSAVSLLPSRRILIRGKLSDVKTDSTYYRSVQDLQNSNSKNAMESNIGKNISFAEKRKFLVNTLLTLKESKEAVYGTLDAWVAWENNFPLVSLKKAILVLEKEEQWHRVVQVIKWMLSKGQGTTMGTYEQLICALEKDNRAEEAHRIWMKKISHDLHSVPWRFCDLMISIYYRNNMLERLVKLFQSLESFGRKYPTKSIVKKVADTYVVLGLLEEKNKLLEKYNKLFGEESDQTSQSFRKSKRRTKGKDDKRTDYLISREEYPTFKSEPSAAIVAVPGQQQHIE